MAFSFLWHMPRLAASSVAATPTVEPDSLALVQMLERPCPVEESETQVEEFRHRGPARKLLARMLRSRDGAEILSVVNLDIPEELLSSHCDLLWQLSEQLPIMPPDWKDTDFEDRDKQAKMQFLLNAPSYTALEPFLQETHCCMARLTGSAARALGAKGHAVVALGLSQGRKTVRQRTAHLGLILCMLLNPEWLAQISLTGGLATLWDITQMVEGIDGVSDDNQEALPIEDGTVDDQEALPVDKASEDDVEQEDVGEDIGEAGEDDVEQDSLEAVPVDEAGEDDVEQEDIGEDIGEAGEECGWGDKCGWGDECGWEQDSLEALPVDKASEDENEKLRPWKSRRVRPVPKRRFRDKR